MTRFEMKKITGIVRAASGLTVMACCVLFFSLRVSFAQTPGQNNDARQPFQIGYSSVIIRNTEPFRLAQVPQGKRLVIEHISFRFVVAHGTSNDIPLVVANVETAAAGNRADHELMTVRAGHIVPGRDLFVVSEPLRLYADPGTTVSITMGLALPQPDPDDTFGFITLAMSGYYVDVP